MPFFLLTDSVLVAARESSTDPTPTSLPEHLTLNNPSGATGEVNQPTNYLLAEPQSALSYQRDQGKPNRASTATRVMAIDAPSDNGLDVLSAVSSAGHQVVGGAGGYGANELDVLKPRDEAGRGHVIDKLRSALG